MGNQANNTATVTDKGNAPRVFWGSERHQLIAGAADQLLTQKARQKVADILQAVNKTTLESVATWLDDIRNGPTQSDDAETTAFINQYPKSRGWHFVDMPLGATGYDPVKYAPFVNDFDVVHALSKAIAVFTSAASDEKLTSPVNALRIIAHLTGDLHQPLHVSCGYLEAADGGQFNILSDPDEIVQKGLTKNSDKGGNALLLPTPKQTNLHSYWDDAVADNPTPDALEQLGSGKPGDPRTDPTQWPALWANDGILYAKEAYKNIAITGTAPSKHFRVSWEGSASYNARCSPIVLAQMKLATQRMALLVNTLFN